MTIETLSTFAFGDITIRFLRDAEMGCVGMELFPTTLAHQLAPRRVTLLDMRETDAMPGIGPDVAFQLDPLAHVKIVGDAYPGAFAQGHTLRNAPSNAAFHLAGQTVERDGARTTVVTGLQSEAGYRIEHRLSWHAVDAAAEVTTTFINDSPRPITLEMLSSFSLGGITPFDRSDAPGCLRVHRFRSAWSAEGRLETRSVEELHLERSWRSFVSTIQCASPAAWPTASSATG